VVKPLPIGFDTRKAHSDAPTYTTYNKNVDKMQIFSKYLTCPYAGMPIFW
jgi:hypothetical protein